MIEGRTQSAEEIMNGLLAGNKLEEAFDFGADNLKDEIGNDLSSGNRKMRIDSFNNKSSPILSLASMLFASNPRFKELSDEISERTMKLKERGEQNKEDATKEEIDDLIEKIKALKNL